MPTYNPSVVYGLMAVPLLPAVLLLPPETRSQHRSHVLCGRLWRWAPLRAMPGTVEAGTAARSTWVSTENLRQVRPGDLDPQRLRPPAGEAGRRRGGAGHITPPLARASPEAARAPPRRATTGRRKALAPHRPRHTAAARRPPRRSAAPALRPAQTFPGRGPPRARRGSLLRGWPRRPAAQVNLVLQSQVNPVLAQPAVGDLVPPLRRRVFWGERAEAKRRSHSSRGSASRPAVSRSCRMPRLRDLYGGFRSGRRKPRRRRPRRRRPQVNAGPHSYHEIVGRRRVATSELKQKLTSTDRSAGAFMTVSPIDTQSGRAVARMLALVVMRRSHSVTGCATTPKQ